MRSCGQARVDDGRVKNLTAGWRDWMVHARDNKIRSGTSGEGLSYGCTRTLAFCSRKVLNNNVIFVHAFGLLCVGCREKYLTYDAMRETLDEYLTRTACS